MKTKVLRIDPEKPQIDFLTEAVNILKNGGLVAFPTDTVYGLGANALDEKALKRLFTVKRRSLAKPIIILVSDSEKIRPLVKEVSPLIKSLTGKFWPGPLTIILEKSQEVSLLLAGGTSSVGVRCPDNEIALTLLKMVGLPVATTSANLSGQPAAVEINQVLADFEGKIDLAIDGGRCTLGIESTVLDLVVAPPLILRPGAIPAREINQFLAARGQGVRVGG